VCRGSRCLTKEKGYVQGTGVARWRVLSTSVRRFGNVPVSQRVLLQVVAALTF
jgi:hypothetical protein